MNGIWDGQGNESKLVGEKVSWISLVNFIYFMYVESVASVNETAATQSMHATEIGNQ